MKFHVVLDLLFKNYGHQALWLAPGTREAEVDAVSYLPKRWPAPKIVTRAGFIVAMRTEEPDVWALTGTYETPYTGPVCALPYAAFFLDANLQSYFQIIG